MNYRKLLGAVAASALLFAIPVTTTSANADTYAPNPVSQDFNGSSGGWQGVSTSSGLCLPALLCPAVGNSWVAGGADGNGAIATTFASVASTLAGTSSSIWTSPVFTYNGLGGKEPGSVTFDMNMLRNVQALLDLTAFNDTSFQVDLVDQSNGRAVSVIPTQKFSANANWTAVPSTSVNPKLLKIGHPYKIQITTSYHAVVTVVAAGVVGYDNVQLTTSASDNGGGGGGGNGGSGITDIKQLRKLVKHYILPTSMSVEGRFLKVHLRCPPQAAPRACQTQLQGLQKGKFSKPATARKIVKMKAGKERTVKIRIKPAYVSSYSKAKKVWVKCIVRVGKVRVAVRKSIKLSTTS